MTYYTRANVLNGTSSTLYFATSSLRIHVEFLNDERRKEKDVMLPLILLIKFVLLLIIFQVSSSFNLLVANWQLSPEFWSPKFFSTHHGDQNGRSLERCMYINYTCSGTIMFQQVKISVSTDELILSCTD